MILGVSGYGGVGKDAFAKALQEIEPFENKKFAGKLKHIASILTGFPEDLFEDRDFKDGFLPVEWDTTRPYESDAPWVGEGETYEEPMTVREFLQKLGTDAIRNHLHPNAWVNALMADYRPPKMSEYNPSKWIITDCRFPNEAQAIKDNGGIVIRINRPGYGPVNDHPSETALDNWEFDYVINNSGNLEYLKFLTQKFYDIWLKN